MTDYHTFLGFGFIWASSMRDSCNLINGTLDKVKSGVWFKNSLLCLGATITLTAVYNDLRKHSVPSPVTPNP